MQRVLFLSFSGLPGGLNQIFTLGPNDSNFATALARTGIRSVRNSAASGSTRRRTCRAYSGHCRGSISSCPASNSLLQARNGCCVGAATLSNGAAINAGVKSAGCTVKYVDHKFGVSGTCIRQVGSLTALLQLACENRDCDSDEHGSERIICELLILLRFSSPIRKTSPPPAPTLCAMVAF